MIKIKKREINLQLNSISKSEDPTILNATFVIIDFDVSHNNALIDKDVGLELGKSIIHKPIVAHYIEVEDINTNTDNFTGHEATLQTNKHGEQIFSRNTVSIGVFTSIGYLMTINVDGIDKEVLVADAVLWRSRYSDACELITEWYNRGITINTSCEFLYSNFTVKENIEYVNSPVWFEGHAILASENRGDQGVVLPAYESSRLLSLNEINEFNRMVAQAHNFNASETIMEGEEKDMKFRKMFELSHDDIRSKLYQAFDPTLPEDSWSWIREVYDDRFVVELESTTYKTYQYSYTKNDTDVIIDFDSKAEVIEKSEWVKVEQILTVQLNEVTENLKDIENKYNSAKENIASLQAEKENFEIKLNEVSDKLVITVEEKVQVSNSFNEATEKLTKLTSEVEELKPFKEQFNEIQFANSLNEKKEFYRSKFNAFSAQEKFESEEVQELIKTCALNSQDSQGAQVKLNSILVDLVEVKNTNKPESFENTYIRELASKTENLIPDETDFDRKYS